MEQASGQYILMTDADSSTRIEELDRLWSALHPTHDIAIGSRYLKAGGSEDIRQPFYRVFIGRLAVHRASRDVWGPSLFEGKGKR